MERGKTDPKPHCFPKSIILWAEGRRHEELCRQSWGVQSGCSEEIKDVREEKGLGGHSGKGPGPSFGGLDRTWDLLVFYSGLFSKAGAQAGSSYSTVVFFMLLDFIARMKQQGPLARSVGEAASVSGGTGGNKGGARGTSIRASSTSCV